MTRLFDTAIVEDAVDFITNILQASTEYSIIGKSLDGTILLWNEGARRLYGYEPEEVVGKQNSAILHAEEDRAAGKPREMMEAALRDGKWEGTLKRRRKNGSHFTARVVLTPRRDGNGTPVGFLLISKDISEEIRLTEQLQATQFYTRSLIESNIDALMTTDPLGIITDVNQQMAALTGCPRENLIGSPFKNYFTEPERAEEGVRRVLREGKVKNYELTAHARDGRMTLVSYNASTFRDAAGKLQGVFAAARDITEQKAIDLIAEIPPDPVIAVTDRRALSQVVINLVNNAIKFMERGRIAVVLSKDGGPIAIKVTDTGVGIKPEQQERLFQAFEQLGEEHVEGTGLGLYLSQKLAGLLGGRIVCQSTYGKGSEFTLILPPRRSILLDRGHGGLKIRLRVLGVLGR